MTNSTVELRDVVRRFGPRYLADRAGAILPSQRRALSDIAACRTREMGGRRYQCDKCHKQFWVYHLCNNRSCPACHGRRTREWVEKRNEQLLGCGYFHIVATVPAQMRAAFLSAQKRMYSLLLKTVAECVIELAQNPRYVGGMPAVMAVLHTWSRDLGFHPHVHLLVSGGGLSPDGEHWVEPRNAQWLVPVRALSALIRGRFRARLKRLAPETASRLPAKVWSKGWNVFCKPCGVHSDAVVEYLGRYVFRTAISNARIEEMDATHVTLRFRSRGKETGWSRLRLRGAEFLRRFVMHVLPRGFQKVRYYGLWHHSKSNQQRQVAQMLCLSKRGSQPDDDTHDESETVRTIADLVAAEGLGLADEREASGHVKCPSCSSDSVRQIERIRRPRRRDRSP
jgi:hypothetical protein